jgi:chromosome segregation ATPase|tara:strand:+ start:220 stop:447 length:228 start_codon:yes stop_codon:yes gene_type:complete
MGEDLTELEDAIKEAEKQLSEMKREYKDKRTASLRAALEARKDIDCTIREELKTLGYNIHNTGSGAFSFWHGRAS